LLLIDCENVSNADGTNQSKLNCFAAAKAWFPDYSSFSEDRETDEAC